MALKTIQLIDSHPARSDQYKHEFSALGYNLISYAGFQDYHHDAYAAGTFLYIINYADMVSQERQLVLDFFRDNQKKAVVITGVPLDAAKRLAFYDLGARRVFDDSYSLHDIIQILSAQMVMLSEKQKSHRFLLRGNLEEASLVRLINNLSRENRSGIIKIVTEENSGKIILHNGRLDDAQVGLMRGEEAFLHMLFWSSGNYNFTSATDQAAGSVITMSNIGLFLMAEQIRTRFIEQMQIFGSRFTVVQLINRGDVLQGLAPVYQKLVDFLSQPKPLYKALENPFLPCYRTLDFLVGLKSAGNLQIQDPVFSESRTKTKEAPPVPAAGGILSADEISQLRQNLQLTRQKKAKLIVIGSAASGKDALFRSLSGSGNEPTGSINYQFKQVLLTPDLELTVIGLNLEQSALTQLDLLSQDLNALVFMLSSQDQSRFEYQNYLLNQVLNKLDVPALAAVSDCQDKMECDRVSAQFILPRPITWSAFDSSGGNILGRLLASIREPEKSKKETVSDQMEEQSA